MLPLPVVAGIVISSCFATPMLIVLGVLGIYVAFIFFERRKFRGIPGPPYHNFFLGNVEEMMRYKMNRHMLWITWAQEWGALFKICIFHKVLVVATTPDLARELCLNKRFIKASFEYGQMTHLCGVRFMGRGLLTEVNHQRWREIRSSMNPAFHRAYLKELVEEFNQAGDILVQKLDAYADGKTTIRLLDFVGRATLDVIAEVAFSLKTNTQEDETSPFPAAVYTSLKLMTESFRDPFLPLKPWRRTEYRKGAEATQFLRVTGKRLIRERLEAIQRGDNTPSDILDIMVKNLGHMVTEDHLVDEFVTLFIAGQETTANSLAFLFSLLGQHPDVMTRLVKEIDDKIGDRQHVSYDDMSILKLTDASWREALRLFPPAYATLREVPSEGEVIGGHRVPGGTSVLVNFLAVHYLHTKNGFEFQPDRYLMSGESANTFMAFSVGHRSCIGRHFASIEAKILICKLLQNFEFTIDPEQNFDVDEALTLRLLSGAQFTLKRR